MISILFSRSVYHQFQFLAEDLQIPKKPLISTFICEWHEEPEVVSHEKSTYARFIQRSALPTGIEKGKYWFLENLKHERSRDSILTVAFVTIKRALKNGRVY